MKKFFIVLVMLLVMISISAKQVIMIGGDEKATQKELAKRLVEEINFMRQYQGGVLTLDYEVVVIDGKTQYSYIMVYYIIIEEEEEEEEEEVYQHI